MTPSQKIGNTTFHLIKLEKPIKIFKQPSQYLLNYFIRHVPEVVGVLDSQPFCQWFGPLLVLRLEKSCPPAFVSRLAS